MENDVLQPDSILRMSRTMAEETDSYGRARVGPIRLEIPMERPRCSRMHSCIRGAKKRTNCELSPIPPLIAERV